MRRARTIVGAIVLGSLLQACTGLVYTHTVEPLTLDLHDTPRGTQRSSGDIKEFRYYVEVQWDRNGIGAIAKKHGFARIDYADMETLQVLGIWTRRRVHVYGTREAPAEAAAPGDQR